MLPYTPLLIGSGFLITITSGIGGFTLATRTDLNPLGITVIISIVTVGALFSVATFPVARTTLTGLALGTLLLFPIYALYWTLHDFIETTVR